VRSDVRPSHDGGNRRFIKTKIPEGIHRDFQDLKFTIPRQPIMKNRPVQISEFLESRM
jgi:hypothetical protein